MIIYGGDRKRILLEIMEKLYPEPGDALHNLTELQGIMVHRMNKGAREQAVTYLLTSITNIQEAWLDLDKRLVSHACGKCHKTCDCTGMFCDDEDCKSCSCFYCIDCIKELALKEMKDKDS